MREIRLYGSEGGEAQANGPSLPLSFWTLRVRVVPRQDDAERRGMHSHGDRGNECDWRTAHGFPFASAAIS